MDKLELSRLLAGREQDAITRTIAMMTFVPAIGRVLQEDAVWGFADLMVEATSRLYGMPSRESFDLLHAETCERLIASQKTARGQTPAYGHAQKPINVFLKVYVDWAKLPDRSLAETLVPFLHVPLDSLLMKFISREFSEDYEMRIGKLRRRRIDHTAERAKDFPDARSLARMLAGKEFSLAAVDKELYLAWQEFFRDLWPSKPLMLDIIWFLERTRIRSEQLTKERGSQ